MRNPNTSDRARRKTGEPAERMISIAANNFPFNNVLNDTQESMPILVEQG